VFTKNQTKSKAEKRAFAAGEYDLDLQTLKEEARQFAPATGHALLPLRYPQSALEPHISRETVHFHYDVHHRNYVSKLSQLIAGTDFENCSLEEIVRNSTGDIFNNSGQAWNHNFYWQCLTPGGSSAPEGAFAAAIREHFGSQAEFETRFDKVATGVFGAGWAWLVQNADGALEIIHTGNAGSPIRSGQHPLLTCDVWEHAYYIDYRNRRSDYLKAFWQLVDWRFVEAQFRAFNDRA
jgi:superoxide dismutase, Fe-Mn family